MVKLLTYTCKVVTVRIPPGMAIGGMLLALPTCVSSVCFRRRSALTHWLAELLVACPEYTRSLVLPYLTCLSSQRQALPHCFPDQVALLDESTRKSGKKFCHSCWSVKPNWHNASPWYDLYLIRMQVQIIIRIYHQCQAHNKKPN